MNDHAIERRTIAADFELRTVGEARVVAGHGAVFNRISAPLGGFVERVAPKAFTKTLQEADVRALMNHNPDLILGRTSAGTLRLEVDAIGLGYDFDVPDTSYGRDLTVSMGRRDITQSSFGFRMVGDSWGQTEDGYPLRTLEEVALVDVSPVTYPAYGDADSGLRSALCNLAEVRSITVDEAVAITRSGQLAQLVAGKRVAPPGPAPMPAGMETCPLCKGKGVVANPPGRAAPPADTAPAGAPSPIPAGMHLCPTCKGKGMIPDAGPGRSIIAVSEPAETTPSVAELRLALMRRRHRAA